MAPFPEKEPQIKPVEERPEEVNPLNIEKKEVVTPVPLQFKAQVADDQGKPLIQTPPTQVVTVQPPADDPTLVTWSKGSITSSLTWLGAFWLRIVKKALHFGWKIILGSASPPISNS